MITNYLYFVNFNTMKLTSINKKNFLSKNKEWISPLSFNPFQIKPNLLLKNKKITLEPSKSRNISLNTPSMRILQLPRNWRAKNTIHVTIHLLNHYTESERNFKFQQIYYYLHHIQKKKTKINKNKNTKYNIQPERKNWRAATRISIHHPREISTKNSSEFKNHRNMYRYI